MLWNDHKPGCTKPSPSRRRSGCELQRSPEINHVPSTTFHLVLAISLPQALVRNPDMKQSPKTVTAMKNYLFSLLMAQYVSLDSLAKLGCSFRLPMVLWADVGHLTEKTWLTKPSQVAERDLLLCIICCLCPLLLTTKTECEAACLLFTCSWEQRGPHCFSGKNWWQSPTFNNLPMESNNEIQP